jgi:PhnB protein
MKTVQPYLIFPGNCREALEFYSACLDGEIATIQTFAEAPIKFPHDSDSRIFNSAFRAGDLQFMASDCLPEQDLPAGANFALFVTFSDSQEQLRAFESLSEAGKILMPMANGFGMVEDRFHVRWMLAHSK